MRPETLSCDVLVVGGGAAGIAAACAAGKAGARVVLLERYGFLGGLATAAQVGTICGLYLRDTKGTEPEFVACGFARKFASRLQRLAGQEPLRVDAGLWVLPFPPPAFAQVADDFVREASSITLALHTTLGDTRSEGGRVVQVRALAWNEPLVVEPKALVDCTGEATAAALAGADFEQGIADQAPSLVFVLENVEPGLAERGLLEIRRELRRAVEAAQLPPSAERLALVPGTGMDGHLALKLNLSVADKDCPGWQQVTSWEREARALVARVQQFLIQHTTCCRNARHSTVAPQLGIRSGHRVHGRYTLADEDVLKGRKFEQGIACGAWPMERWGEERRPEMTFFTERDYYEIPLDCLRPAQLENVFAAGRCFSASARAMTSARVIGTALATGWAAGTAAAFHSSGRPLHEAIDEIRHGMAKDS